jgi:predicted nucleic acid-binding protein
MSTLLDANILTRLAQPSHPMHKTALDSVAELRRKGEVLCIIPQNLYEFWVVVTRPAAQNGLGMSPTQAQSELSRLKALFSLLDETPAILPQWEQLVAQHQVSGKNAHDAHLVAAMMVHRISRILTFNVSDFQRYQSITAVEPHRVLAPPPPTP